MKRIILISAIFLLPFTYSCEQVRKLAGRPTSAEVEDIRLARIQEEEARHQARLDSLRVVQQQMQDSLAALEAHLLDSLSHSRGSMMNTSSLGGLDAATLQARYCIVVGAFRNPANAERKASQCNGEGYSATIIAFRNGLNAVCVCPSDDLNVVLRQLRVLRGNGICPSDAWILVNE